MSCSNAGHYSKPRYTCPSCYEDLPDISWGQEAATCACGAKLLLQEDTQPVFTCILLDEAGEGDDDE